MTTIIHDDINSDIHTNYDEWEKYYMPIPSSPNWNMFETYGHEVQLVEVVGFRHVWTMIEEDGNMFIINGMGYVNRIGYFITKNPWSNNLKYRDITLQLTGVDN